LAATGKTAKAGKMWYNLKGMMVNGEELMRAREIQCKNWAKEEVVKEEKEMKEFEELQDTAYNVYNRFRDVAGKKLKNL
jgi:hypothetical protein